MPRQNGDTPLHLACELGRRECALLLLERCPSAALLLNKEGLLPIHMCCKSGHDGLVLALLSIEAASAQQTAVSTVWSSTRRRHAHAGSLTSSLATHRLAIRCCTWRATTSARSWRSI